MEVNTNSLHGRPSTAFQFTPYVSNTIENFGETVSTYEGIRLQAFVGGGSPTVKSR